MQAVYKTTWTRILNQMPKHAELAKRVLLWVFCDRMPPEALRRAVATCPDTHIYDEQRLVPESLILSVCCGLVEVAARERDDELSRVVQFIRKSIAPDDPQAIAELLAA
jgi:hypothetical protein